MTHWFGFDASSFFTSLISLAFIFTILKTSSDVEEPHVVVSSTVDCAFVSNDNKITDRQITANTIAKQHDLDMLIIIYVFNFVDSAI